MYKRCNQPITSFGCIAYRIVPPTDGQMPYPEFLMVQRKDSLAFVEFIRGKYVLENVSYIKQLLANMTQDETDRLQTKTFSELWKDLWMYGSNRCYMKEQHDSENKLNQLRSGYQLVDCQTQTHQWIDMNSIMAEITTCLPETEWGFPKGRRNLMESDRNCAIREFKEETGIKVNKIRVRYDKPIDEVFTGSNHVRYKHVYYIVEYIASHQDTADLSKTCNREDDSSSNGNSTSSLEIPTIASMPPWQASEIRAVQWFTYDDALKKLERSNVERRELLKRVYSVVKNNNFTHTAAQNNHVIINAEKILFEN
jgi:ADP-ribose pyrophosphatase YjhB (NUDIX family)